MSSALSIGTGALNTNLAALQVIGNNIANASTEGYSRQTVATSSAGYQKLGGLYFGNGVQLDNVTRSHSEYLTRESRLAASAAAADTERYDRLQTLESIFPTGDGSLGTAVNSMLNVWSDVAAAPSNLSARTVALARADELTSRMRETVTQMDILATSSEKSIDGTVDAINLLATSLAAVNLKIIGAQGDAGEPNDLLDQRDQLLSELSEYVGVSTVSADDGSVSVFIGGSQPLVMGGKANSLVSINDPDNPNQQQINLVQGGVKSPIADAVLGGSLGGTIQFLNEDLPAMETMLGRMALALETAMNIQHNLGIDLDGNAGGDFFVASANATSVGASANTGNAVVHSEVVDFTALRSSDYQISFDAAGVNITRLSDGETTAFTSLPAELDGLSFELDSGAGAVGDNYVIRPFENAARGMQMATTSARQLAVGSPVAVTPASTNSDGMSIESLYAVEASANLTDTVSITFLADGTFTATGLGPDNPAPDNVGPPSSYNFSPGTALEFNGWSMTLRGTPVEGDTFEIAAAPAGSNPQNSGNATAMLALRDAATFDGVTLSEGYGVLLAHVGTEVQSAKFSAEFTSQLSINAENANASVSGVNLDEEAARLLQYQQAYQAAAKYMQIVQSAFDTLLQTVS